MSGSLVAIERDGPIVQVRLTRPEKLNAQSQEMWHELRLARAELVGDTSIRALILSGEGRSFSAGLDTAVLSNFNGTPVPDDARDLDGPALVAKIQESFTWFQEAPYPTIAAVQGHALGAGCQLALACDLRLAADDAIFALPETNWGLMPDLGGTVWLPQLVGPARAKELMWLADRIDAEEAFRLGLVNRVVPVQELQVEALALAERLVRRPPLAVTAVKRAVEVGLADPAAGFVEAGVGQLRCLASNDLVEAGTAWLEQRDPVYTGT